jgi:hypothetical protein
VILELKELECHSKPSKEYFALPNIKEKQSKTYTPEMPVKDLGYGWVGTNHPIIT